MADDDRLPRQRQRSLLSKKHGGLRNFIGRRELAIYGILQHDLLNDFFRSHAEEFGLLWYLLLDQSSTHEAWTDHIRPYTVLCSLFGDRATKTNNAVLRGDIRRLQH